MMPVGDTGRGPIVVLGYPFLRSYYTVFDYDNRQLGFLEAKEVGGMVRGEGESAIEVAPKDAKKDIDVQLYGGIDLKGIRPV
jgi:hypothetical protein